MKRSILVLVIVLIIGIGFAIYRYERAPVISYDAGQVQTTEIIQGETSLPYHNDRFGFTISHPESSKIQIGDFENTLPVTQTPVVGLPLPDSLFSGTNLIEAGVFIGVSEDADIVRACTQASAGASEKSTGTAVVASTTFSVFTSKGAASGNIYEATSYRTVHDGSCFELVELVHSGNIANYTKGQVAAFDRAKYAAMLDTMLKTFRFTDSSSSGVQGTVRTSCVSDDGDSSCIPHAYTMHADQGAESVVTIQTSADGSFRQELPPGQYELRIDSASTTRCASVGIVVPDDAFISTDISCQVTG